MNIQALPWLKFAHEAYLLSEFKAKACAVAKAAYFDLLCFAMKQTPALSLPNDDTILANWASTTLEVWQQIKATVLAQFSFNQDDNRYYSPMLIKLYSDTNTEPQASQAPRKRSSSAERVARHRAKQKTPVTHDVTPPCNTDVTPVTVTSNTHVTPSNVTLGGKGGDLEFRLENLEKEVVVNKDFLTKQSVTPCNAVTPKSVTPQTTTKFCMHFDFKVEPSELAPFMSHFKVPMSKHTPNHLNHFVAHYLTKGFKNTRIEWVYQYAMWLKREKEETVDKSVDNLSAQVTKSAADFIQPVKPLWETLAERKAEREAQPPKNESALAALALAQIKKSVGLKAA